jgi:polyisoprenoid-binding protein YceI
MRTLLLLCGAAACFGQTAVYRIAPEAGNRIGLEVYKTGLMSGKKHVFIFERYQGRLDYDAKAPEASKVELTIETSSIVLKDQWLSEKDFAKVREYAGKEMLEVAKYPQIRFVSSGVRKRADGVFEVNGGLTIKGVTKPAVVSVTMGPAEAGALRFTGKAEVKLKDYGLKPPSAALGMIGTKNEMPVEFNVTGRI